MVFQADVSEKRVHLDIEEANEFENGHGVFKEHIDEEENEPPSRPCCYTIVSDTKGICREFCDSLVVLWGTLMEEKGNFGKNQMWEFAMDRFPPLRWAPVYNASKFYRDMMAGLVVGCTLIPQGISYASLAQLPAVHGLYTAFAPLIVYTFFGTSRQMGVGPVTIVSSLIGQGTPACYKLCFPNVVPSNYTIYDPYPNCPTKCNATSATPKLDWNPHYQQMTSIVALACGIIFLIAAPLLGWILNFVPHPVVVGFTSGGGLIIALGQLKYVQGYDIRKETLQAGIYDFFSKINQTHGISATMGWLAIAFLFFIRKLGQGRILWWKVKSIPQWARNIALLPWAFALIVLYTGISAIYGLSSRGVVVVGKVPPGLPTVVVPEDFASRVPQLASLIGAVVIVGYLESISVENKFANMFKYQINPTQEAFAQGWANVLGGLTQSYPAIGSFSRSAINAAYGSQSPICNLIAAMVVMVTLLALTGTLYNMPQCGLAAVVIVAGLGLVEWDEFLFMFRTNWKDFAYIIITFCCTCFNNLESGIFVATCLCALEVLYKATRPKVVVVDDNVVIIYLPSSTLKPTTGFELHQTSVPDLTKYLTHLPSDVFVLRLEGELNFAATSHVKRVISSRFPQIFQERQTTKFVFETSETTLSDSTAVNSLITMFESIQAFDIVVCFVCPPKGIQIFLQHKQIKRKFKEVELFQTLRELEKSGWLTRPRPRPADKDATTNGSNSVEGTSSMEAVSVSAETGIVHSVTPAPYEHHEVEGTVTPDMPPNHTDSLHKAGSEQHVNGQH